MSPDFAWPAPAKLNLFLHIRGRRLDGYHELQTVFQFLDHGDTLRFAPRADGQVVRAPGFDAVPEAEDLCVRAARLMQQTLRVPRGCSIALDKRLPMGAGLGGGSSNAATTLVALNLLWGAGRTTGQLAELGRQLGADVPVFVHGHAAWGEGVGEILKPVEPPERVFLVVTPDVAVSTREIFSAPELPRDSARIDWRDFLQGRHRNDCEATVVARHPEVGRALEWLGRRAPARMTGTGASVFAAFDTPADAQAAQREVPAPWRSFVAHGRNQSPLHVAAAAWAKQ